MILDALAWLLQFAAFVLMVALISIVVDTVGLSLSLLRTAIKRYGWTRGWHVFSRVRPKGLLIWVKVIAVLGAMTAGLAVGRLIALFRYARARIAKI